MTGKIYITTHIGNIEGQHKGVTLYDIVSQVQSQPNSTRFIVEISSPGGSSIEADQIADFLDRLQDKAEVIGVGRGLIASAASKIFLTLHRRAKGSDDLSVMIHNPWGGVEGDADWIEKYADEVRKVEKDYEKFYVDRLGLDEKTISDLMANETYIDGDDLNTFNIINHTLMEEKEKIYAIVKPTKNEKNMTEQDKTFFTEILGEIKNFFKPANIKAVAIMTNEGVELNFPGDAPVVGDTIQAPDGTYTFSFDDANWTAVIENNTLTSLTEVETEAPAENEELDALKAENENLKQQLQSVTSQHTTEVEELKKNVMAMKEYVDTHKQVQTTADIESSVDQKFEQPIQDPIMARLEAAKKKSEKINKFKTNLTQ